MDRRDALKKLGVGGAVAVAGPVLLDSFNVASASSNALPPVTNAIVSSVQNLGIDGVRITLAPFPTFPSDTSHTWAIVGTTAGNNATVTPSGPIVVVDRPGTNTPSVNFVVRMTATSTIAADSRDYYIQWTGGTAFNVSPSSQV